MPNDAEKIPFIAKYPPLIPAVSFAAGLALHFGFPLGFPEQARHVSPYAGAALILFAGILSSWAARTMKKAGVTPSPREPKNTLTTGGPFRYTRNPLYIAMMLLYAGIALILRAGWMIALLPLMFLAFNRLVKVREEPYLEGLFREDYLRYKLNVRRWL